MKKFLRATAAALAVAVAAGNVSAAQVSDDVIRIGLLSDLSGPTSDYSGQGAIEAIKLAVADMGGKVAGHPVEFVYADHQNKPDIAIAKAREWFDVGKVDVILGLSSSSVALAVNEIAKNKKKITFTTAAGTTRLTNEDCTPYAVHYVFDSYALTSAPSKIITKSGGDTWFLIVADFAYGLSSEQAATKGIESAGGKVIGTAKHPFVASDFSSLALQAISSDAKVIGLANSSTDTSNAIRALQEFGLKSDRKVVAFTIILNEIHGLGLDTAQGLQYVDGFYWDRTPETREFSKRFAEKVGRPPNMINAGDYSAAMTYLKAVDAAGTDDSDIVMKKLHELPINDVFAQGGTIRADGRMAHDMYLVEVKKPSETKYPWDYLTIKQTIPADQAFTPLADSKCSLVKK